MQWKTWIRPILIFIYFIFLFIVTPLIIWNTVKDGFEGRNQLILVGSLFVFCALPVSFFHFAQHLKHFNKPILQKHIIRIIMMIPVYSLDALFGLIYPTYSLYVDALREIYEAYVIYNFMRYLLNFLNLEMDFEIALQYKPQVYHFFPLCFLRPWRMGRELVHNCKHGILQYTIVRPLTTVIAIICQLNGVYGESTFSFKNAYIYTLAINNLSQFCAMYCLVLFYKANYEELKPMKPLPKFLCIKSVIFFSFIQGVLINILVNYGFINIVVFNSDTSGDTQLLSSRLQNFLICIEMFLAALAHQYSFPYKTFQITDADVDGNWFKNFLLSLDVDDVRQDISEHFGVVGDRIAGTFRSQPSYLQYSESDRLISPSTYESRVVAVTRVKQQNYGSTYGSSRDGSQKYRTDAIGKNNKRYRIVEIEDGEQTPSSSTRTTASTSNMTQSMMSTTSTTSSYGINVRGPENDPINYRNPDV